MPSKQSAFKDDSKYEVAVLTDNQARSLSYQAASVTPQTFIVMQPQLAHSVDVDITDDNGNVNTVKSRRFFADVFDKNFKRIDKTEISCSRFLQTTLGKIDATFDHDIQAKKNDQGLWRSIKKAKRGENIIGGKAPIRSTADKHQILAKPVAYWIPEEADFAQSKLEQVGNSNQYDFKVKPGTNILDLNIVTLPIFERVGMEEFEGKLSALPERFRYTAES